MKKLILLLVCMISTPLYASIEQAKTAFKNGNLQLAEQILSQQSDNNYQKSFYLALIASSIGKLDEAEEYIEKTLELNAKDAEVQFSYAEIMAKQAEAASIFSLRGYIKKVKNAFIAAVELAPENIQYRRALIQFHINAPGLLGGDIEEALKHARALKKVDPLSGAGALIQVHGKMGNDKEFGHELKIAMQNFVDEPDLFYQLGLYYQEQENFSEALIHFRKAANLATSTDKQLIAKYSAVFQLARTSLLSNSNFDEAEKAFSQYIDEAVISSSMPSKNWAMFRLANIIEAQGKQLKALGLYKELYKDLDEEYSDKELLIQVKNRIKKLS